MRQRGRPRHPDVLTPREWEVLSLIREGLSNPEIGARLGISADAAKYHVSEILTKLNVPTRAAAAAWRPGPAKEPVLRPAWARALGWPLIGRIALGLGAAALLAGLALLAYGLLKSSDNDGATVEGSGTPTASASASPSATASSPAGVGIPVTERDSIDLPSDVAVIVETGCIGCDGPTTSLTRVDNIAGRYATRTLFTPATVGLAAKTFQTPKGPEQRNPDIVGYAIRPDASDIVVGVSYGFDLGAPSEVTDLYRSRDGGVTWQSYGQVPAGYFMLTALKAGQIIVGTYPNGPEATLPPASTEVPNPTFPPNVYQWFPSGQAIPAPDGANNASHLILLPSGDLAWATEDGHILDGSGSELFRLPGNFGFQPIIDAGGSGFALASYQQGTAGYEVTLVDSGLRVGTTYSLSGLAAFGPATTINGHDAFFVNASLESPPEVTAPTSTAIVDVGSWPSILDASTGDLYPIPNLISQLPSGRNFIVAARTGNFAMVKDTGSCLNIRESAVADAAVVECVADGVLLSSEGDSANGFLHVRTPSGNEGWASIDFLQLSGVS